MPIYTLESLFRPLPAARRRVALGVFDGLHIGHRAVLSHTLDGDERAAVLTITHVPKAAAPLLSAEEEEQKLAQIGIDDLIRADLSLLRELTPQQFVDIVLCRLLGARAVCCGFNYRFGKDRAGDVETLRTLCAERGIAVTAVPAVMADGAPVSSSRIRDAIAAGEMQEAERLLGYPYTLTAPVEHGFQLGRRLGFPTLNQSFPADRPLPRRGVYASAVLVDGQTTFGVTNIGIRPTVHTAAAPLAETWLPDVNEDLYGKSVSVSPLFFLRPEQSFDSLEELSAAVHQNGEQARQLLSGDPSDSAVHAVLFDFDDTLHDRRVAFERFAYALLTRFFPDWDDSVRHERAHRMMCENNGGYIKSYESYFAPFLQEWNWPDGVDADTLTAIARRRFPDHVALFPDTVAVLTELRRRGLRLGIITNGNSQMQNRKVDVSGLRPLVDLVVVSGDEGVHKPDGELFRRAAARLGVPPHACLYVGDHPVNDIQGAQNGGMRPVYIDVHGQHADPPGVMRIAALTELLPLLG